MERMSGIVLPDADRHISNIGPEREAEGQDISQLLSNLAAFKHGIGFAVCSSVKRLSRETSLEFVDDLRICG